MPIRSFLKLAALILPMGLSSVSAECPKTERLAKDDMWCINDRIVPNYVFDTRDFNLQIRTQNNGTFRLNLRGVRTAIEKQLGNGGTRAEIIGYNPQSHRDPHQITIFVGTKEQKEILDSEIEKTKKTFSNRCFHCVLSEKPPENRRK